MKGKKTTKKEPLLFYDNELLGSNGLVKVLLDNLPDHFKQGMKDYLKSIDEDKYNQFIKWSENL